MRIFATLMVATMLASPLFVGSAHAFNTVTDDTMNSNGTSRFTDPDEAMKYGGDSRSSTSLAHTEGSFTYGIQLQSGNSSGFGGYGGEPSIGRDSFGSSTAPRPFDSYIPRP